MTIAGSYDPSLVALSILVALVAVGSVVVALFVLLCPVTPPTALIKPPDCFAASCR